MRTRYSTLFFLILLLLPLLVAAFEWGFTAALLLVLLWLTGRWLLTLNALKAGVSEQLVLDSIPVSHYVEKVRWCLDKAALPYTEVKSGGTIGAFFLGRTVPRLWARTGLVWSSIGNSDEILRFIWGQYGHTDASRFSFLKPSIESVALERQLDAYGRDLQIWVYHNILPDRALTLKAWGAYDPEVPWLQRNLLKLLFPVLRILIRRAFVITPPRVTESKERIEALLRNFDERLSASNYLVAESRSYIDYSFAALSGLWLQTQNYANGKATYTVILPQEMPEEMLSDINSWRADFTYVTAFIENLYAHERKGQPL